MAHQGNVAGVVEELVDIAEFRTSRANDSAVNGAVHVADEVKRRHGEQEPGYPPG